MSMAHGREMPDAWYEEEGLGLVRSQEHASEAHRRGAADGPFGTESVPQYVEPPPLWARPRIEHEAEFRRLLEGSDS
jgi:hypothetical protein